MRGKVEKTLKFEGVKAAICLAHPVFYHLGLPSLYPALELCMPSLLKAVASLRQLSLLKIMSFISYLRICLMSLIKLSFALLIFSVTILLSPSSYLFKHPGSDSWRKGVWGAAGHAA